MNRTIAFNLNDPISKHFQKARDDLASMRASTSNPAGLEWQLRCYDFMLAQPDADAVIYRYCEAKQKVADRHEGLIAGAKAAGFTEPYPTDRFGR